MAEEPEVDAPLEPPIAGTPALPTGLPVRLNGTSQGRAVDIPPSEWIQEELIRYGVIGSSGIQPPNLKRSPHPIFHRKRFPDMDDRRFNAMRQSILLASTLLEIGYPFLAAFLPEPNYAPGFNPREDPQRTHDRVDLRQNLNMNRDMRMVKEELDQISKGLEWREDPDIFRNGWWGITASVYPRATKDFSTIQLLPTKAMDERLQNDGYNRRQVTIAFVSLYIDTIMSSLRTSEQHFCATFHLAVTMVHEIGHLVYWQNLGNKMDLMGHEPVIEYQVVREIGFAFTAWIFGGWNPAPILDFEKDKTYFDKGMYWVKQLTYQYRPRWTMNYSMPFKYVQRLLTQSTWDAWEGNLNHPDVKSIVEAGAPFRYGHDARLAICEKREVGRGRWVWKKRQDPHKLFNYNEDDDEDFPSQIEGFPPFKFYDEDWTAGPEIPWEQNVPAPTGTVAIKIKYSGIYDAVTGHTEAPKERGRKRKRQQNSNTIDYADWPEGILRSHCSKRDLSSFGKKSELVARLEMFDAERARTGQFTGTDMIMPGAPEESNEDEGKLTYNLDISTTVNDFQLMVLKDTGIPPNLQMIWLNENVTIEQPPDSPTPLTLARWHKQHGWDDVALFRIRPAPQPDPGPLEPGARARAAAAESNMPERNDNAAEADDEDDPTSARAHLRRMLRSRQPDAQPPWDQKSGTWPAKQREYQDIVDRMEVENANLRESLQEKHPVAADLEFRAWIEALVMTNRALKKKLVELGVAKQ